MNDCGVGLQLNQKDQHRRYSVNQLRKESENNLITDSRHRSRRGDRFIDSSAFQDGLAETLLPSFARWKTPESACSGSANRGLQTG